MRQRDWLLKIVVALLAAGVWALALRPVLAPTPTKAAEGQPAPADEVRAKRFVLVDEEGRERAVLGFPHEGEAALTILSLQGRELVKLGTDDSSGPTENSLQLLDGDGRAGVKVAFTPRRNAVFLGVPHRSGQPSGGLNLEEGGLALYVMAGDRKSYGTMEVTADGTPRLRLTNDEGRVAFSVPTGQDAALPMGSEARRAAMAAVETCFMHLRDGDLSEAAKWVAFENQRAREEWEQQVADYGQQLDAGGQPWWGDPIRATLVPGSLPGQWAVADVQWRYHTDIGWMMAEHHTYKMRTVDGEWRLYVDEATTEKGIPWVPAEAR
jgi:hypothetical protein